MNTRIKKHSILFRTVFLLTLIIPTILVGSIWFSAAEDFIANWGCEAFFEMLLMSSLFLFCFELPF